MQGRDHWAISRPYSCACVATSNVSDFYLKQFQILALLCAEGGVYYSDQQFVSAGGAGEEAALPQRAQALSKFGEFIRTFQIDPKSGAFPYA